MSIGLLNKDASFFTIETLNSDAGDAIAQEDIISLSITEEMEKITMGALVLYDPNHSYSRILREGVIIKVSWGYKNAGANYLDFSAGIENIGKQMDRRGFQAIIMNPSGGGDEKGVVTYSANFTCMDFRGLDEAKVRRNVTKGGVVEDVLTTLGVSRLNMDIRFAMAGDMVGPDGERQDGTAFRYLAQRSKEWNALFRIGYSQTGDLCAVFISSDNLATSEVAKRISGGSLELHYNAGEKSNVSAYTWQCHEGENGAGDNVKIEFVNGEAVFRRFTVESETVITWELDMNRVREELAKRGDRGGVVSETTYVMEVLSAKTFEDKIIKSLFRQVDQKTAPNGLGYTINVKMLGTPFAVPPAVVTFATGFPDRLLTKPAALAIGGGIPIIVKPKNYLYYLRKATHQVTRAGYFTDLEVSDVYLLAPTGQFL